MRGPRRSTLILSLWGLLVGVAAVGCRRFEFCVGGAGGCAGYTDDGSAGDGGSTGVPSSGGAGTAAAAGSGGALSCVEPILSCDDSTLNGCETDTRRDPLHCGRCGNACTACGRGRCLALDLVDDTDGVLGAGIVASTDHVYFLATSSSTHLTVLRRLSKANGEVVTLAEGLNRDRSGFTGLAVGLDRVYIVDRGALLSVPFSGSPLRDENVATSVPPLVNGAYLYVWKSSGRLLRRELTTGSEEELALWDPEITSNEGHLALLRDILVVGAAVQHGEDAWGWELGMVDWPDSESIASGTDWLKRVRTLPNAEFDVVWLVDHADSGGATELRGYSELHSMETLIAEEQTFTDFCLSEALVYANLDRGAEQGLRALSRTARPYADIGLRQQISDPLCDGDSVYFFDRAAPGLFRLSVEDL